jgi:soluble lytic murein transglycosylase-like protein
VAAMPFQVTWIPIGLFCLLAVVSAWSWRVLQAGIADFIQDTQLTQSGSSDLVEGPLEAGATAKKESISPALTPEVTRWSSSILPWAERFGLDPNFVAVVMQIESCGHPRVLSPSGAIGLFQVMPFHFSKDEDPFDPDTNAKRGLGYLARSLEIAEGRYDLAFAGYNGGHSVIAVERAAWPQETQRYVDWGVNILQEIRRGDEILTSLQAWLNAGGDHLCTQAAGVAIALNE